MKSKNLFLRSGFPNLKMLAPFLFFLGLTFNLGSTIAQDVLSKEQTTEVFKSIAKYTSGASDKTSNFLKAQGYEPPKYLAKEWKQFPAIRKIEMAYEAAEFGESGKGGKKFLSKLSKNLSQRYEAVKHEEKLGDLFEVETPKEKVKFKHPTKYGRSNLPGSVKKQIMSISKYTEVGALGGTRGVLKHKFGLSDDAVYDILRKSKSSQHALETGLAASKVPPTHKKRLQSVSRQIQNNYEAARKDKALSKLSGKDNPDYTRKKVSSSFKQKTQINNPGTKPINTQTKSHYNSYGKKNYATPSSRKFKAMRIKRGGFGGVIFGNEVEDRSDLPGIKQMKFIPTDMRSSDSLKMGMLELVFEDGSEYLESSLLVEDIIAAHEIVFGNEIPYVEGEGIGLAGIENSIFYPDSSTRWEVVIHPAIANLELGWATLFSDVFPIASEDMLEKLEDGGSAEDYLLALFWSKIYSPDTWKIIDVPIAITNIDQGLSFYRSDLHDSSRIPDVFITMEGFGRADSSGEEEIFYQIFPSLRNSIHEFHRINQFAKTLALFRWAKKKGGFLVNLPKKMDYVATPHSIFVSKEKKIVYHTLEDEVNGFRKARSQNVEELFNANLYNNQVSKLHTAFLQGLEKFNDSVDYKWEMILNEGEEQMELCEIEMWSPDSLLATSNFKDSLRVTSDVYIADSLTNTLENVRRSLVEIELLKLLSMSQADSILAEHSPDSLIKFNTLLESVRNFNSESEEEQKLFNNRVSEEIDTLLSHTVEGYSTILLYQMLLNRSLEVLKGDLNELKIEGTGYLSWRMSYEKLLDILKIEQRVFEATQTRYCE